MFGYKIGYRIKVWRVYWRRWKNRLDNSITPDENKIITPFQEKGIKLLSYPFCLFYRTDNIMFGNNMMLSVS